MVVRSRVKGTEFGVWNFVVNFFGAIIEFWVKYVCDLMMRWGMEKFLIEWCQDKGLTCGPFWHTI